MTQATQNFAKQLPAIHSPSVQAYRDKAVICRQGELNPYAYHIVSGHVKLTRLTAQGEEFTVVILPAGEIFGTPLADHEGCELQETAYAKGNVRVYRFHPATDTERQPQRAASTQQIIRSLAKRQAFLQRRLEHLLFHDVEDRVGAILCDLITRYGGKCGHGHEIDIRLTQQELAELVGTSRPVISTVLNQLRRRGIVSYTRQFICIDDLDTLRGPG